MKKIKFKGKILYLLVLVLVAMFASIGTVFAAKIIASNGVSYSNSSSGLSSTNVQGALDELYGKYVKLCLESGGCNVPLAMYLRTLEASDTVEVDDGTEDHNMRYIGPNPNNYVSFNGELWRIIGVFNSNSHGMDKDLVKIQYTKSLGKIQWDETGINDWARPATLNTYLNEGEYYTSKLKDTAKNMIQEVTWKLGGTPYATATFYPNAFYNYERGSIGTKSNPTVTEWNGNVALAYASDYLYSTTGGATYDRKTCFAKPARNINNTGNVYWRTDGGDCATGSWMIQQARTLKVAPWTLTSRSDDGNYVFGVHNNYSNGVFYGHFSNALDRDAIPAVYLKSNVTCTNCNDNTAGTDSNPYKLSLD